jgi:hypothetical protein
MTRILFRGPKARNRRLLRPALPPGFDAEKINAGIAVAKGKIGERGRQGDICMITPDEAGRVMLEKTPRRQPMTAW